MFTGPFSGIDPDIESVLRDLIPPEDDYHYKHLRRFARTLQVLKDQKPSGSLLELGTSGVLPLAINELMPDVQVWVTNFNPNQTPSHFLELEIGPYVGGFGACNVDLESEELLYNDEEMDWVICCEVIEHMEIDPMFMLSEVNRVLKPGGGLLVTTPNAVSSRSLTKMVAGVEPYFYMQYNKDRSYHRHNYEYSVHSLSQVIRAAGFDGSIWTEDTFEDPTPAVADRLRAAGFNIQHIGDNIMTVARKVGPVIDRHPAVIYVA